MKDEFFLFLAALVCAGIAWGIWHFLGHEAFNVLVLVALIVAVADNVRMRRRLTGKR